MIQKYSNKITISFEHKVHYLHTQYWANFQYPINLIQPGAIASNILPGSSATDNIDSEANASIATGIASIASTATKYALLRAKMPTQTASINRNALLVFESADKWTTDH